MKIFKKKAELSLSEVGKLILLVVGLLVLILVIFFIRERIMSRTYDKSACTVSVIANSKIRLLGAELWSIDCPTRYVRFTEDGYIEESGKRETIVTFRDGNKKVNMKDCSSEGGIYTDCKYLDYVNKAMAEHIYDCWDQFGAGMISVFNHYSEDVSQCVICTVFEFDEDVKNKFGKESSISEIVPEEKNLDEFMRTNGPVGREISYYEFCQDEIDHFKQEYYDYQFGKTYAVVFSAYNENYIEQFLDLSKEIIQTLITKRMQIHHFNNDEQRFINALHFIEQQEVSQTCDILAKQTSSGFT